MADSATAQPCKGLSWTYDAWGNRSDQTMTAGTCGQFHATINAQNRVIDPINNLYQYDAAGNMTRDASHSYAYDAENRMASVDGGSTATYVYDAFGRRTKKTVGANIYEYTYDNDGNIGWELLNGVVNRAYVRSNGLLVAEYFEGTTYFPDVDHLGSTRLLTRVDQSVRECDDYYPYGEANSCGVTTGTTLKFTGDERDTETTLDHTWFRQNSSTLGRWMTPDPAGLAAVDPTTPQSWNRYAYVANNPLSNIDPTGLVDCNNGHYGCGGCMSLLDGCSFDLLGGSPPPNLPVITIDVWAPFWGQAPYSASQGPDGSFWGGGSGGGNGSWTGTFLKTFFTTLPSTGPGSCIDVALSAVKGPLDAAKKYGVPVANALSSGSAQLAISLNNMLRSGQLDPFLGPAVAAGATTVAAGASEVSAGVATAAPYVGYGLAIGAEGIALVGVVKEGYAAATGKCHP